MTNRIFQRPLFFWLAVGLGALALVWTTFTRQMTDTDTEKIREHRKETWKDMRGLAARVKYARARWLKERTLLEDMIVIPDEKDVHRLQVADQPDQAPADESVVQDREETEDNHFQVYVPELQGVVCKGMLKGPSMCSAMLDGRQVVEGDRVGSYRVVRITPSFVVLENASSKKIRLDLKTHPWQWDNRIRSSTTTDTGNVTGRMNNDPTNSSDNPLLMIPQEGT